MKEAQPPTLRRDFAILCLINLGWVPAFFFVKDLRACFTDTGLGLLRFGLAAAFLWVLVSSSSVRSKLAIRMPSVWGDRLAAIAIGAALVAPAHLMYYWGMETALGTEATLLGASAPIVLAVAGAAFLGERLTWWQWSGVVLGFVGVYGVVTGKWGPFDLHSGDKRGNLIILLGFLMEMTSTLMAKRFVRRSSGVGFTVWSFTGIAVIFLALSLSLRRPVFVQAPDSLEILKLGYLAFVSAGVLWTVWYWVMERLPVGLMGPSLYVQQVGAAVLGYLAYGDRLAAATWQGGLLILFGIWLCTRMGRRRADMVAETV